jgi:predicted metal-dependent enzyme (double-stranded beta helix superfamily)
LPDAPVQAFLDRLSSSPGASLSEIGAALAALAMDADYFAPMIAQIDPEQMGGFPLHVPERGPRLFFLHRPRGVMSAVHSHGTWIAVACVAGIETHQSFSVSAVEPPDRCAIAVSEERVLSPGDVVSLSPPKDVHSHGHRAGSGEVPFSLILTGDDQLQFVRREYDVPAGRYRDLAPGDFGTLNLPAA